MKPFLVLIGLVTAFPSLAIADYLEIRRNAQLKRTAESNGQVLQTLTPGTLAELRSEDQRGGYYKACLHGGKCGFVYRTLVRRHPGAFPPGALGSGDSDETPEGDDADTASPEEPPQTEVDTDSPFMRAHLINVGQGAATLFEFNCGTVLVDTGGELNEEFDGGAGLEGYLENFFNDRQDLDRKLDLLVVTHAHIDHTRNIKAVTGEYTVENVVTNGYNKNPSGNFHSGGRQQAALEEWARTNARLETVTADSVPKGGRTSPIIDPLHCDDVDPKIRVLWGQLNEQPDDWNAEAFKNANNHSVVLRVDYGKSSFLITGDLEDDAMPNLIAKHAGSKALDVDVWQVSHHGSHNGTDDELLAALTPTVALIASGSPTREDSHTAWAYGHPRQTVIDQLLGALPRTDGFARTRRLSMQIATGVKSFKRKKVDEAIYATGWDGTVVVTADAEGTYEVRTEK